MPKQVNLRMPSHIERLPAPDAPYYIWDGKEHTGWGGFGLQVQKSGRKVWVQAYRVRGDSKKTIQQLGTFDPIAYAYPQARAAAERVYTAARDGRDPAAEKKEKESARGTVAQMFRRYIDEYARLNKKTWMQDEYYNQKYVVPAIGHMAPNDVTRDDVRAILAPVGQSSPVMADRLRSVISAGFRWGDDHEFKIDHHPTDRIRSYVPRLKKAKGTIPLRSDQVYRFWHGLDQTKMMLETRLAFRFLMVTGVRPNEAIGGRWDQITGGQGGKLGAGAVWEIPGEPMKMGEDHRVPLSGLAREVLEEAWNNQQRTRASAYFFPSRWQKGGDDRPMSVAVLRNGTLKPYGLKLGLEKRQSPYSLRKFVATTLGGLQHPVTGDEHSDESIGMILAHARGVTSRYNHAKYDRTKLMMLEQLADEIRRLIAAPAAEVARVAA